MTTIAALNHEKHKNLKIDSSHAFLHSKDHHLTFLSVNEYTQACTHYPIVFIKGTSDGNFNSIAILGLEKGENLFLKDNKWQASYIPANVRRHPFFMTPKNEEKTEWSVCIDESSEMLSEKEGQALFEKDGSPTHFTQEIQQFLTSFIEQESLTLAFCKYLDSKGLLKQTSLTVKQGEDKENLVSLSGMFIVDEDKLDKLSNEDFLELKNKGCLKAIYAHLSSLNKIQNLAEVKLEQA